MLYAVLLHRKNSRIAAVWPEHSRKDPVDPLPATFFFEKSAVSRLLRFCLALPTGLAYGAVVATQLAGEWSPVGVTLVTLSICFTYLVVCLFFPNSFRALMGGLWFSLVNSLRIGFRHLSVGTWLTRMQPREYVLEPRGWLRAVAGIQSVVGLYLLALLLLTYFQPLFEV